MAKKKDNNPTPKKQSTADYYKLKTDAVDRLVNADKKTYDKTKGDPGKAYKSKGFLDKIPSWIKALFIKFWFNGAVCYFIFWGLGSVVTNYLDMIFVLAIVLGMVTDIFVNNALRFVETLPGENDKWMMFPQKKYWTFIANIFYSFIHIQNEYFLSRCFFQNCIDSTILFLYYMVSQIDGDIDIDISIERIVSL